MLTIEMKTGADEDFDFWDIPDHRAHFFPLVDNPRSGAGKAEIKAADELDALVEDYHRAGAAFRELVFLRPEREESYRKQFAETVRRIEQQVKKLLGNRVKLSAD